MLALVITGLTIGGLLTPVASADDPSNSESLYELVDAATVRLQTADPVAASKWLSGSAITDPVRVQQVLEAVSADAQSVGVPSDFVTTAFTDQINATEAIQYNRFSMWKLDPAIAPLSAPDLSASRSLIDDLNHRMVGLIAVNWPVLDSPDCATRLSATRDAVAQSRQLDLLYRQALDTATRSYCGT